MKNVVIIGGGGISKVATAIIDVIPNLNLLGYLDDFKEKGVQVGKYIKHEVIGNLEDVGDFLKKEDVYFFIAFAGFSNPEESYKKILEISIPKEKLINIIHQQTYIPNKYCKVGDGILVAPFAQIGPESEIGDYTTLLGNSFIGHNTLVGNFVHIASNAVIGANNKIGQGTHIGTNSVTRENVIIGKNVIVGSGSVVLNDIPDNAIVVGNPARIVKYRE